MPLRVPLPGEQDRVGGTPGFAAPGSAFAIPSAGATTQELGRALTQAGLGVAQAATELRTRQNISAAKRAQALAEERITQADLAYTSLIGQDATGDARARAFDQLGQQITKIGDGLDNEDARALYHQNLGRMLVAVQGRWGRHEIEQTRVAEVGAGEAALQAKIALLRRMGPDGIQVASAADPARPVDPVESVRLEARRLAAKKGWGPEQTDQLILDSTSQLHVGIVEDLVGQGRGSEARDYLEAHQKEVSVEALARARDLTRRASVQQEAVTLSVQIRRKVEGRLGLNALTDRVDQLPPGTLALPLGGFTVEQVDATQAERLNAGLAEVQRALETGAIRPELAEATRGELQRVAGEQQAQRVAEEARASRRAEAWMIQNPTAPVSSLPADLYEEGRRLGLLDDWNAFSGSAKRYSTDRQFFDQLFGGPEADKLFALPPDQFIERASRRLDPQDLEAAKRLYQAAHHREADWPGFEEAVREAARKLEILPRQSGQYEEQQLRSEQFYNLHRDIQNRVLAEMTGSRPSLDEIDRAVGRALQDRVRVSGLISSDLRPFSALSDQGQRASFLSSDDLVAAWRDLRPKLAIPPELQGADPVNVRKIPKEQRAQIEKELRAHGLPVTEAAIAIAWVRRGRPGAPFTVHTDSGSGATQETFQLLGPR